MATMVRITIGNAAWIVSSVNDAPEDAQRAMVACYQRGDRPMIDTVETSSDINGLSVSPFPLPAEDLPFPDVDSFPLATPVPPPMQSTAERIASVHAQLSASDPALASAIASGRRMGVQGQSYAEYREIHGQEHSGRKSHESRRTLHDRAVPLKDAAHSLIQRIEAEHRSDVTMSALEFCRDLHVNGRISVNGKALTEQAIRGLAARLESPMLSYVLGMRERAAKYLYSASEAEKTNRHEDATSLRARAARDRETIAEILTHECRMNPEVLLKLRTRNNSINDVFAIVSPSYAPADAPAVVGRLVDSLDSDAKGESTYDPSSTAWELKASVWTPTPVDLHAVGEPFAGYASLRGKDNGTGKARGGGGIEILACLNACVYTAASSSVSRVHRGRILHDVHAMIDGATKSIGVLCQAWGKARNTEIRMTPEEKQIGDRFMQDLFAGLLKSNRDLVGVLPGRTSDHASNLVAAYHAERRDPARLVRSDVAQAWTRYIQGQPAAIRQDAEDAIGSWVVS